MNSSPERSVAVFPNRRTMDGIMFEEWAEAGRGAVRRNGRFVVALSGGRTPVPFYERLARDGRDLPWGKTHIFLADERAVPEDHPDSNIRMIRAKLLDRVPIPAGNVHPVAVELAPGAAAQDYEMRLRRFFGVTGWEMPRFDLVLLGLGEEGHTASLFPGAPELAEVRRLAVPVVRTEPDHDRVSLTLQVIDAARLVVFLVAGRDKARILKTVVEGDGGGAPAALVRPKDGRTVFLADEEAGSLLTSLPRTKGRRA